MYFTELLPAVAEVSGTGILDAAVFYRLYVLDLMEPPFAAAELDDAASWTLLRSTRWLPWTSRSCCLPSRSSAAQAPLDAAGLDILVASHLAMPLLAAAVLGGPGILGVAVRYMWIVVDLAELLLAVTGLTRPCI